MFSSTYIWALVETSQRFDNIHAAKLLYKSQA